MQYWVTNSDSNSDLVLCAAGHDFGTLKCCCQHLHGEELLPPLMSLQIDWNHQGDSRRSQSSFSLGIVEQNITRSRNAHNQQYLQNQPSFPCVELYLCYNYITWSSCLRRYRQSNTLTGVKMHLKKVEVQCRAWQKTHLGTVVKGQYVCIMYVWRTFIMWPEQ